MKVSDWFKGLGLATTVIAWLNRPLPVTLRLPPDMHDEAKFLAAFACVVALGVAFIYTKTSRTTRRFSAVAAWWGATAIVFGLIYSLFVQAITRSGLVLDLLQKSIWISMFVCMTVSIVVVAQAAANDENSKAEEDPTDPTPAEPTPNEPGSPMGDSGGEDDL